MKKSVKLEIGLATLVFNRRYFCSCWCVIGFSYAYGGTSPSVMGHSASN
jgi:hypothetical protein